MLKPDPLVVPAGHPRGHLRRSIVFPALALVGTCLQSQPCLAQHHPASPEAALPIEMAWVGGKVLITTILDPAARAAGFQQGDEVLQVDGVPVREILGMERGLGRRPVSPDPWRLARLGTGIQSSLAVITTRNPEGQMDEIWVTRRREYLLKHPVQAGAYELEMTARRRKESLTGSARVHFKPTARHPDSVVFFLHHELTVDSVFLGDRRLGCESRVEEYFYNYSGQALRTRVDMLGGDLQEGLTVHYHGPFHPFNVRSPSDYMRIDADGVLLRAYGYSLWFPVLLESGESSHTVSIPRAVLRVPRGFTSVFVGSRLLETTQGDQIVSEWAADSVDLMQIQWAAQRWEERIRGNLHAYHYPDDPSRNAADEILDFAGAVLAALQDHYRSGIGAEEMFFLEMPPYGMISSRNVSTLPSELWADFSSEQGIQRGLAHEMVHPFVDFRVPFEDPSWALVKEAFPAYLHLPILALIQGEKPYQELMDGVQSAYLERRESGHFRGKALPPERPLLEIGVEEVGAYKDTFVLNDRGRLFQDWLRRRMGPEEFLRFVGALCTYREMDQTILRREILARLPGVERDLVTWLETTEFPQRFRR